MDNQNNYTNYGTNNAVENPVDKIMTGVMSEANSILSRFEFKEEKWWLVMLLSIITGGTYGCYYRYRQLKEIKTIEANQQVENRIPFILYLLLYFMSGTIAGIVLEIIYYKRLTTLAYDLYNTKLKPRTVIGYLLVIYLPIISWYVNVNNHNKVISLYKESTKNELNSRDTL